MDSSDPTYPAFPILALIGFVLVLVPLPWHLQAWNAGTCLYMFWTAVGCLSSAVNAIVWKNDAIDRSPIWCNISTRLQMGITVGIPAASLCINRRLYKIATSNSVGTTRKDKRNALLVDTAIALGIPALQMIVAYIVQGHNYDIFEGIGCHATLVNTPLSYPLVFLWPIIIGVASAVYCILTLKAFMHRRAEFAQFLSNSSPASSSLTVNRYFRLMALATSELVFNLPISIVGLYLNARSGSFQQYTSWEDIHFDFNVPGLFPAILWRSSSLSVIVLEMGRWPLVLCAFLFFGFFGFAEEARRSYAGYFWNVAAVFGKQPPSTTSKISSLPSFIKTPEKNPLPASSSRWKRLFNKSPSAQSEGWRRMSGTLPSFTKTNSVVSSTVLSYSPYSAKDPKLAPVTSSSTPPTPSTCKFSPAEVPPTYSPYSPSRSPTTTSTTCSYSQTGAPKHDMPTPSSLRTSFDQEYRPNSLMSITPPVPPLPVNVQRDNIDQSGLVQTAPHRNEHYYSVISVASTAAATIASTPVEAEGAGWPTPIYAWVPRTPTSPRPTSATF